MSDKQQWKKPMATYNHSFILSYHVDVYRDIIKKKNNIWKEVAENWLLAQTANVHTDLCIISFVFPLVSFRSY